MNKVVHKLCTCMCNMAFEGYMVGRWRDVHNSCILIRIDYKSLQECKMVDLTISEIPLNFMGSREIDFLV